MKKLLIIKPLSLDFGLLLLRLVFAGIMMIQHGYPKLLDLTSGKKIEFYNFMGLGESTSLGLAVFAEFFCSALVVLGLFHRLALVPLIITMAVAFFGVHLGSDFGKGEAAFIYMMSYVILFFTGPGKISADDKLFK